MTSLSELILSAREKSGVLEVNVPEDWMQGRSVFGGLQVAIALKAMRSWMPEAELRTLQATFVAPVPSGLVRARAEVLRRGTSATHVEARILDEDKTQALVIGIFGAPRSSRASFMPSRPQVAIEDAISLHYTPGVFPSFTQHFTARWLRGTPPFSGRPGREQVIEVGMREQGPTTESHVIGIADFIPPIALSYLDKRAPGSTLTWMMEFLSGSVDHLPLSGFRVDAVLDAARDGYTSQSVTVWGPDGAAVALSRQSMMVFG